MKTGNASAAIKWLAYYICQYLFLGLIPYLEMTILRKPWNQVGKWFRLTGKTGLKIFGINAEIYNPFGTDLENTQYIMVANHRSWFDQVAVTGLFPRQFHILANIKYFKMPTLGFALRTWQGIPVENEKLDPEKNDKVLEYIKRKDNIFFFIEGTRGKGKKLLPFKRGAFRLAAQTGVPILPMYIFGGEDCLHKSRSLLSVKSGELDIVVGGPVMFNLHELDGQIAKFSELYETIHNKLYDSFYAAARAERWVPNVEDIVRAEQREIHP